MFLNLEDLQPELEKWVEKSSLEGKWSSNSINITNAWLREGLKPRCITRDLKWGTPVPKEGYEKKVFYVWFDAPIGYLSITANYTSEWEKWWKVDDGSVKLFQFMGKDNVPFHTVLFPSSLLGTGDKWTLLHHLSTTEYLQYEDKKFSKSRGVGVFGNNVAESQIPCDVWRYYLLSNRPETNDTHFTWDAFLAANNSELLANLGNFMNRVMKFATAKYNGIVPVHPTPTFEEQIDRDFVEKVNALVSQYLEVMDNSKSLRTGLRLVMEISSLSNWYLQENKLDNKLFDARRKRCDAVIHMAINACYLLSALIYPFLPVTAASMINMLNAPMRRITDGFSGDDIKAGHTLGKAVYLFKEIPAERAEELRAKYSGQQQAGSAGTAPPADAVKKAGSKRKAAAAAMTLLSEVPAGVTKTETMMALEADIRTKGDIVRRLKEGVKVGSATKAEVTAAVAEMNADKGTLTKEVEKALQSLSLQ